MDPVRVAAKIVEQAAKRSGGWDVCQAEVVSLQADGTITVKIGGAATEVPGVKVLDNAGAVAGEGVFCLSSGRDLFAIGRLASVDWLTSGITAASGWTVTSQRYRRVGPWVQVTFTVKRAGQPITAGATGNIANTPAASLPAGFRPLVWGQGIGSGPTGRVATWYANTSGIVDLVAIAPGADIVVDDELSCSGTILA